MEATIMRATKVARSALNNHTKIIEKALHDGVTCIHELDDLVKEFEKKSMNLEKAHNAYINILQNSELDETIEEIDTYVSNRKKSKFKVISKLQSQNVSAINPAVQEEDDVKLSRIELLHFDGDILNWKLFNPLGTAQLCVRHLIIPVYRGRYILTHKNTNPHYIDYQKVLIFKKS